MKLCLLFFSLACLTGRGTDSFDRLIQTNTVLIQAISELTGHVDSASGDANDATDWFTKQKFFDRISTTTTTGPEEENDLGPAEHCMDLASLDISYESINDATPCLKDYCASLKTAEECHKDENFHHGCSWCAGSCKPYISYQEAFIKCVRDAYEDHEPDKVNGQVPPYHPSSPEYDREWTNTGYATPGQGSHWFYGRMRWSDNENKRKAGDRVPIHVHPFPGLSCITTYDAKDTIVWAQGEPEMRLKSGTCYSMPPMKKLGPHSAGGYSVLDTFVYDTCYPLWVVLEPGATYVQDEQFVFESDLKCDEM